MLKDKDIREPLFDFLEEQFGKVRIIEEKNDGEIQSGCCDGFGRRTGGN